MLESKVAVRVARDAENLFMALDAKGKYISPCTGDAQDVLDLIGNVLLGKILNPVNVAGRPK